MQNSFAKCPICESEVDQGSDRKRCHNCGNGNRTRTLHLLYRVLEPITREEKALIFTSENWLPDAFFSHVERSIYLGKNHLDVQDINRDSDSYGWISSNHVLEHVADDRSALREMYRVLAPKGTLQLTVPTPSRVFRSKDWGFADSNKMGHFRNYGAEFLNLLRVELRDAHILCVITNDNLTEFHDLAYLISKKESRMERLANTLMQAGYISVPISPL